MKIRDQTLRLRNHLGFILWPLSIVFLPWATFTLFTAIKRGRWGVSRRPAFLLLPGGEA